MQSLTTRWASAILFTAVIAAPAFAQRDRVAAIDTRQTVAIPGHVRPSANAANDQGMVADSFPLSGVTMLLQPSAAQKADLATLLGQQQDPNSPAFHQWLTPEQFADRFAVSSADLGKIRTFLESQGFTVNSSARARNWISFNGTAGQVRSAFQTEIHRYSVNGQTRFANASNPQIPAALANVVAGFRGLDNFRLRPHLRRTVLPQLTTGGGVHHMAPDDFATIYDVAPLYQAGIDGAGQSLVVVGQTDIHTSDLTNFRTHFNLPALNLKQVLVPGRPDPGVSSGDMAEADLDIEWSGAVARNAQIIYVYSDDVVQSAYYAVDNALAPVMTMSYGGCEEGDLVDLPTLQNVAQQANAQGMTWFAASGDQGAADCEDPSAAKAQNGLNADAPGSIPEVTSMGGTEFLEGADAYWNTTNSANQASALSYIPEVVWNDSVQDGQLASGGGGISVFFPRPAWQQAAGLASDGYRHVPDLSFSASADHDGYYVVNAGSAGYFGGTSVAAPTMAGVATLLNHYLTQTGAQKQAGLGNINPTLYRLAASNPSVFHDVVGGSNIVPCVAGSPNCVNGQVGWNATAGYDNATGLGSVDVNNFVHQWATHPATASAVTPAIDANPVFETSASSNNWTFHLTLSEEAGIATTLTGLTIDGADYGSKLQSLFGTTAIAAHGSITAAVTLQNVAVPKSVDIVFTGADASGTQWTSTMTIPFSGPQTQLTVGGIANAASGKQTFAPGMIVSIYGTGMGNGIQAANNVPLPDFLSGFEALVNGVPAPIYYVSPTQVNVQIPYETQTGRATLTVGNPYKNVNYNFQVSSAAPGIFTFQNGTINPFPTAKAGDTITLFMTGEGQVSPAVPTGTAPSARATSQLPKPVQAVSVTVGGLPATVTFVGIPNGLVGVSQLNFTIPATVPTGAQSVVVTVGTSSSPAATVNITN